MGTDSDTNPVATRKQDAEVPAPLFHKLCGVARSARARDQDQYYESVNEPLKKNPMGVFSTTIKLRNWQNRFLPEDQRGEDVECNALVDSGAAELALPAQIIDGLKLEHLGEVQVYTADGGEQ